MIKKTLVIFSLTVIIGSIMGCSLVDAPASNNKKIGGILKSEDGGVDWRFMNEAGGGKNISKLEVLAIAIDPSDKNRVYLGTKNKGIAITKDNAISWEKLKFPAKTVYKIEINPFDNNIIYAAGVKGERGKVYKSIDRGETWREIYSEPADGTRVTSLALDNQNSQTIFIGNSDGDILKSKDGGNSWQNSYSAKATISQIVFSGGDSIYFVAYKKGLFVSNRNGEKFKKIDGKMEVEKIVSVGLDQKSQVLYIGTESGLFKVASGESKLSEVPILSGAKKYPIRAIAINPNNSYDIIFSAAQVIYRSVDNGKQWSTFQLNTQKLIANIVFVPNSQSVYAGLRDFSSQKGLLGL